MNQETIRRDFHSGKRVFFKDIMLPKNKVENELKNYKSDYINLKEFNKKVYEDPIYSKELPISNVVYANFNGDWLIDSYTDEYGIEILKFIDNKSGQYVELAFADTVNKMKFANEVYSSGIIKQEHPGMGFGELSSQNVLNINNSIKISNVTKIVSTAAIAIFSIFLINKKMKN